jgi:UDP-4-amino-4,6-dideoxy-N-acetyl-beta-L-altrosamine N-acetyltransferase
MNLNSIRFKNFIDLTDDEKLMVLSWRNDANIRKWMYSSEIISKENHFDFVDSLKNRKTDQYFLVQDNEEDIGVIYFNKINYINSSCYFGFYGKPRSIIRGLGRILEEVSINYAFNDLKINKLKLEVFNDNMLVRNLHKKYNFKEVDKKNVNEKQVICMELIQDKNV